MTYRLLCLLCLLLSSCNQSGKQLNQKEEISDVPPLPAFDEVVELFHVRKPLSKQILSVYFNTDTTKNIDNRYKAMEVRPFSAEIMGLVYKIECSAGGYCESNHLAVFNKAGELIDQLEIGHHFGDKGFDRSLSYEFKGSFVILKSKDIERFENSQGEVMENVRREETFTYSIDPLLGQVFIVEQSMQKEDGACNGSFKGFGVRRAGRTYHIYKCGRRVNLMNRECQFIFGEGIYNNDPEIDGVDTVITHLIDVEAFVIPSNGTEYGSEEMKAKVICVSVNDHHRIRIIVDPFGFGIYKAPKGWGSGE